MCGGKLKVEEPGHYDQQFYQQAQCRCGDDTRHYFVGLLATGLDGFLPTALELYTQQGEHRGYQGPHTENLGGPSILAELLYEII